MTPGRGTLALLVWSGLAGATGVALAAAAAHKVQSPGLVAAANLLMIHAAASVAVLGLAGHDDGAAGWYGAALLMLIGSSLFAGDVAMSAFANRHLFPMAAPTGGSTLILAWLALAGTAVWRLVFRGQ